LTSGTRGMETAQDGARTALALLVTVLLVSCAGPSQEWARPGAARISKLAVLPFENQTSAVRPGASVAELLVSELLASGPARVIDVATGDLVWTASYARSGSSWRQEGLSSVAQSIARDMAAHLSGALGDARAR